MLEIQEGEIVKKNKEMLHHGNNYCPRSKILVNLTKNVQNNTEKKEKIEERKRENMKVGKNS